MASQAGNKKDSEITAFRELLSMLELTGCVVVADALHCNAKSAKAVVDAGADYVFVVKDNQPKLHNAIETYIQGEIGNIGDPSCTLETDTTIEKNGGRIERRTSYVCHDISWLEERDKWQNLSMVGAIHREVEKDGVTSSEWHYYIASTLLTAIRLLAIIRAEWGVESMHWLLDVHFCEDKTRVCNIHLQKNLNFMRKVALNLVKTFKLSTGSKMAVSKILKRNLFDLDNFTTFWNHLQGVCKLD